MSKIIPIILVLLIIVFFLGEILVSRYENNCDKIINDRIDNFIYTDIMFSFFKDSLRFPFRVEEVEKKMSFEKNSLDEFINDPYSFGKDNKTQLLPIYNANSNGFFSCVIISTGLDGHFDNNFTRNDSITPDQFKRDFMTYNKEYPINTEIDKKIEVTGSKFLHYLFGNKDIILYYFDIIRHIKLQSLTVDKPYSIEELIKIINNYNIIRFGDEIRIIQKYFWVKFDPLFLNIEQLNNKTLLLSNGDFIIEFNFLIPNLNNINLSNYIEIATLFSSFDEQDRKLIFNQTIILGN
ncbi:MAG: hypothetical protein R6X28_05550 [Bacteroidales bacterium]